MPETNTTKTEKHQNPDAQDKAKIAQKFLKDIEGKILAFTVTFFLQKAALRDRTAE